MAKILIVDDSVALRMQVTAVLAGGGHDVIQAKDGEEGWQTANAHPDVQVILADINMPGMDGIQMCEKIRADTSHKRTPILMLTTESSPALVQKGKALGVVAWLIKPFPGPKVMLDIIAKVMQK